MKKLVILILFLNLIITNHLYSQTIFVPTDGVPLSIEKCGKDKDFKLTVVNNSTTTIVNASLLLNLPTNAYYTPNSVTATAPINEFDITNLNQVVLEIPNLLINEQIEITYKASITCDFDFNGEFIYNLNTGTTIFNAGRIANLIEPNLLITNITNNGVFAIIGDVITRDITIIQNNNDSNELNTFILKNTHTSNISILSYTDVLGNPVGTLTTIADGHQLELSNTDIQNLTFGSDGNFNDGETITLQETVQVLDCLDINSELKTSWGCANNNTYETCQETTNFTAVININEGAPEIVTVLNRTQKIDFCQNYEADIVVTNDGSGGAYNLIMPIGLSNDGTYIRPYNNDGIILDLYHLVGVTVNGNTLNYVNDVPHYDTWNVLFSSFTSDPDGVGGLDDLDGDGEFDDLPIGESFTMKVEIDYDEDWVINNPTCLRAFTGAYTTGDGNIYFEVGHHYESMCGNLTYIAEKHQQQLWIYRQISAFSNLEQTNIGDGDRTVLNTTYYSSTNLNNSAFFDNGGVVQMEFTLLDGLDFDNLGIVEHNDIDVTANVTVTGNVVTIISENNNADGTWSIPVIANCATITGDQNIEMSVVYKDGICNKEIKVSCLEPNLQHIFLCNPCPESIGINYFEATRTSFGFTDATGTTRVTNATPNVNLKGARSFENVDFTLAGNINNTVTNGFAEVRYQHFGGYLDTDLTDPYFINPTATVTLASASGTNTVNNVAVNMLFNGTNLHTLQVDLDALTSTLGNYTIGSVLTVTIHTKTTKNIPVIYSSVPNLKARFTTNPSSTSGGCPYSTLFYLERFDAYNYTNINRTKYGCNSFNLRAGIFTGLGNSDYIDNFPNEYHTVHLNSVGISLEGRWSLVNNTAQLHGYDYNLLGVSVSDSQIAVSYANGQTFFTVTNPNDGTWLYEAGFRRWSRYGVSFEVLPDCDMPDGAVPGTHYSDIIDYYYAVDNADHINEVESRDWRSTNGIIYYNLARNFTLLTPTYLGVSQTAQWDVAIENTTNYSDNDKTIKNNWLKVESPSGEIIPTNVQEIDENGNAIGALIVVTQIGTSNSWFAELGDLTAFQRRNFRVLSDYTTCSQDDLIITQGFNCGRYPSIVGDDLLYQPNDFMCNTQSVTATLLTTDITLHTTLTEPVGSQDFCTNNAYSLQVFNLNVSRAYNNQVVLTAPVGLEIFPGSSSLDFNGTTTAIADPVLIGNQYTWIIDDTIIPFLDAFGGANPTTYNLNFETTTVCGFNSGKAFNIDTFAASSCGNIVNNEINSSRVLINDSFNSDYELSITSTPFYACGPNATVNVVLDHLSGNLTSNNEYFEIEMPSTISYANNLTNINNTVTFIDDTVVGLTRKIRFNMPSSVASGDTINFTFETAINNPELISCTDVLNLSAKTTIETPFSCNGVNCDVSIETALADSVVSLIRKADINLNFIDANSLLNVTTEEEEITINYSVENTSTVDIPANMAVEIYVDVDNNGTVNVGDTLISSQTIANAIPANNTETTSLTVSNVFIDDACSLLLYIPSSCICSARSVEIDPIATVSGVTIDDQSICITSTLNIGATAITASTYSWSPSLYLNDDAISDPTFEYTGVPLTVDTDFLYVVRITRPNGCSSTELVTITLQPTPIPTTTDANPVFCVIDNPTVADLNIVNATTITSPSGTMVTLTDFLESGTYTAIQTLNGCNSSSLLVNVTINSTPTPTVADANPIFCTTDNPTVADLNINNATTITNPTGTVVTLTDILESGTYTAIQTLNNCDSLPLPVTVIINNTPVPTVSDASPIFCDTDNPTVANLNIVNATTITNPSGVVVTLTDVLEGGTYTAIQTLNGCNSLPLLVNVIINSIPTPTVADANPVFCVIDNPTVTDLNIANATTIRNPSGTIVTSTDTLENGIYTAIQTLNGCNSLPLLVNVTINSTPTPTVADANPIFCTTDNPTVADLNINNATTITNPTGTVVTLTDILESGTYTAIQTLNNCDSLPLPVTVIINNTPVPTVSDASPIFCDTDNPTVANLNIVNATTITNPSGVVVTLTDVLEGGTYTAIQTLNGCNSSPLLVNVTINSIPTPTVADANPVFCAIDNPTVADLNISNATTITSPSGTMVTLTDFLESGTYTAIQTLNGCNSSPLLVNVNIKTILPPQIENSIQQFCSIYNPTVSDLSPSGLQWYDNALPNANLLAEDTILTNGTIYYGSQTIFGCESVTRTAVTANIIFNASTIITITDILITDNQFSGIDIEIIASGDGDYEYSVDDSDFQDSNIFNNLSYGYHVVNVRDKNGCLLEIQKDFTALDYPMFFTPNNDGSYDTWNINNPNSLLTHYNTVSNITIFNRYGKVMAIIDPNGTGWDGNYLGKPAHQTDYWFTIDLIGFNGTIYVKKGHFSLVR